MSLVKHHNGFTLIETIIYIALFTLVIGGAIISSFQIFDGQARIQDITRTESEIDFMRRKISWILNGASNPDIFVSTSYDALTVFKGTDQYELTTDADGSLTLSLNTASPMKITNSNVFEISNLIFTETTGSPGTISINMNIDGDPYPTITYYVRSE